MVAKSKRNVFVQNCNTFVKFSIDLICVKTIILFNTVIVVLHKIDDIHKKKGLARHPNL